MLYRVLQVWVKVPGFFGRLVVTLFVANWLAIGLFWYNAAVAAAEEPVSEPPAEVWLFVPLLATTMPLLINPACGIGAVGQFSRAPVVGSPADHPDLLHGDLNLALRGYESVPAALTLVDINGPADADAPQLTGIFADGRVPAFRTAYQVYEWNWACGEHGCRGDLLQREEVTLLGMETRPGEPIQVPARGPQIYPEALVALVLYAEPTRITLTYLREDTVAHGYAVHLENVCVDPALLALYQELNQAGRGELPALHNGEPLGYALGEEIQVAVRDRGKFMEPRSRKDWWQNR